jgi:hypothetical protein
MEADPLEVEVFLDDIKKGVGPLTAAYAVNWTQAKLNRLMRDSEFRELFDAAKEMRLESVEETFFRVANKGNVRAMETILFCHGQHHGWRPPTQRVEVNRTTKTESTIVVATVEAAKQLLAQADPAALQPGGALDIIDAEVVDDDG